MKLTVLDGKALNPGDLSWDIIKEQVDTFVYHDRTRDKDIIQTIGDSDAVLLNKTPITEQTLQACPNLKYIGVLATGYNVVDIKAAAKFGVVVSNVPNYSTNSVAQHTFALILEMFSSISKHNNSVKSGDWSRCPDFSYSVESLIELAGKRLGIIGYGNIGKKVAQIAKAFDMQLSIYSEGYKGEGAVSLQDLLSTSDVITLHVPLNDKTRHIINKNTIRLMKDGVYIVNTARGELISEKDLIKAVKSGKIKKAALDVLEKEPIDSTNPIVKVDNIILTPHIAWAPIEARGRLLNIAADNLKAFIEGKPLNKVN